MLTIDRSSPVPYYHQLKEILRADIAARGLGPGEKLPGDHELCEQYGVSRTVVRQALADLQYEGVLERVKGRGTFVVPQRTSQSLVQSLTGLYDDVAAMGRTLRSEVNKLELGVADSDVAARLGLEPEAPVVLIERLRFVDDEPWVFAVSHVPADLAPDLVDQDLRAQSLYGLLEHRYGVRLVRSRRTVEAHSATRRLAKDLQIRGNSPVLKLTNVAYGADGRAVETFVAYHRADRSRFEVVIEAVPHGRPPQPLIKLV